MSAFAPRDAKWGMVCKKATWREENKFAYLEKEPTRPGLAAIHFEDHVSGIEFDI